MVNFFREMISALLVLKKLTVARCQWFMPANLAIQEAEIRRIAV
jgi:hypothetical protein